MQIQKRNGSKTEFNVEKIHNILNIATEGITGVSVSDIALQANLNLYEGMTTKEIHDVLVRSANNLISEENPNYQKVAARLLLYSLRKDVWGGSEPPRLYEHLTFLCNKGIYDKELLEKYSESEIHKIGKFICHDRDDNFFYSGLQQVCDKYLLKNRKNGEIYETPQFAYIVIAMAGLVNVEDRINQIKKLYNYLSTFKINIPTPIMAGLRTPNKQYASCVLCDVGDSLHSIFSSVTAIGYYTAKRAGIGINIGRIRPINSEIRGGEVIHTGIIPYLKTLESTVKATTQNGLRGGGATVNIPFWHSEIEDVVVLKNNAGTDDNRVRKLDYVIQLSKLFYDRVISNGDITLFSPHECQDLYDAFGMEGFDDLYRQKEISPLLFKKTIKARALIELICRERLETGRIYVMNIDHVNYHGSWKIPIKMQNLCIEVCQPTNPLSHIDDQNAEIGICVLSAINLLETKLEEYEDVCSVVVNLLDEVIDNQDYPVKAGENFCKNRRSLGVGFTNLAGYLAKNKVKYDDPKALELVDEISERLQFFLLKASNELAKTKGKCNGYDDTKYSDGVLPIDTYNKNVDNVCQRKLSLDWEGLRSSIKQHGLRHSTLTAQMPCESSSVIQNSTNGIEPVRALVSHKKSKGGVLKQLVPNYAKHKNHYSLAFELKNDVYTNISSVIQKYFDMAISTNHYYNYSHYENNNIPMSVIIKDLIYAYKMGLKSLYYANSDDNDKQETGCESGACAI